MPHIAAVLLLALLLGGGVIHASDTSRDFADLSIVELLDETVTSASKKPTSILRSPAAITVVTQEDLRRLGITTLPEALRFVTGMQVARVSAHSWAISARGFQGVQSDKLLVMIDGRTIYEFTFPGVNWDATDTVLGDIDRIEVIRGPGATLWGANAVNGVVNIITKNSRDTTGSLVSVAVGSEERPTVTVRHGGQASPTLSYRVFAKYFDRSGMEDASGKSTPDDWSGARGGFRLDWEPTQRDSFLVEGDASAGAVRDNVLSVQLTPPFSTTNSQLARNYGSYLLGNWTRTFSETSHLSVRSSLVYTDHTLYGVPVVDDTLDLDVEHRFAPTRRQDVVWGFGTRQRRGSLRESNDSQRLYTAFAQDEISLSPGRFALILGTKVEKNDFTGIEWQPSLRLLWTPSASQTVWTAASRAVRTPSEFEVDGTIDAQVIQPNPNAPPIIVRVAGARGIDDENLHAYELGYRIQASHQISIDLATFVNRYDELIDFVAGPIFVETSPGPVHLVQPLISTNLRGGTSYGAELGVQYNVSDSWRLAGDYSWLTFHFLESVSNKFDHPERQARLRSYLDLSRGWEINGAVAYTGALRVKGIPSYVRLDLGTSFHPTSNVEIGLWLQNLLESRHAEFTDSAISLSTQVPRSALLKLIWRF